MSVQFDWTSAAAIKSFLCHFLLMHLSACSFSSASSAELSFAAKIDQGSKSLTIQLFDKLDQTPNESLRVWLCKVNHRPIDIECIASFPDFQYPVLA